MRHFEKEALLHKNMLLFEILLLNRALVFSAPGSYQVKQVDNENMIRTFQNFLILDVWQQSHMDNNWLYKDAIEVGGDTA